MFIHKHNRIFFKQMYFGFNKYKNTYGYNMQTSLVSINHISVEENYGILPNFLVKQTMLILFL